MDLGDGMAAAEPGSLTGTGSSSSGGGSSWRRRSWRSLTRATRSASFDDSDALAAPAVIPVDHAALQLLRQRALSGSLPGARRDPFKLGLVVEGGGMRGCVSGGALQALNDLGLRNAFDAVYGSSAGAINATYFLSGQRDGVEIYHDHIASPQFINLKRLWRSGGGSDGEPTPVLNLSFLIDEVMQDVLPLDWDAVLGSPVPLKVVASSLDTLDAVLLSDFTDPADLAECLKASATVPEIAGGPRLHRGQRLVDAAVFEPVPFRSAIADGCTHILVLCTRPLLQRRSRVNSALTDAMEVAIKKAVLSPDYMVPAWKAEVDYLMKDGISQDDMLLAAARQPHDAHELPWFAGAHVFPLIPGPASNLSPLCIDVPTLKAGVAEGRRGVLALGRALLGDTRDFSRFFSELESSNIVPARSPASSSERLWRRYLEEDFSHHA
ncbi:Patatin Phospholipase A2-related [Micractinium conductrix]|uniref:Patatin n=1 Tax=Micractinium conductrix TaxID=554055 RepID=A0A2P6VN59_9CHLO|nr:Patatin Phospholipase A2-related [Micractinium conductrix]|eukprot:PSC75485.1 Patatin Phospholipase A2-related [Micractinium conductrix]